MERENEAASCFIEIRGALDHDWGDYLGELTMAVHVQEGQVTTILCGSVADFAAFVGFIGRLQNLGLTVQTISFHRLPAAPLV